MVKRSDKLANKELANSNSLVHLCAGLGCNEEAKMRCPTCDKNFLLPTYFCSQTCFKRNWSLHKVVHRFKGQDYPKSNHPMFDGYYFSGNLRPSTVEPQRTVPDDIPRPDYWETGIPKSENAQRGSHKIAVYTDPAKIQNMREACALGRKMLDFAGNMVKPGVTCEEIDQAVHEQIVMHKAYPSPLNYNGFPKSLCTSVNEVICHGIPDNRPLFEGDIVNIDITVYYKGFHADLNETFAVGKVSPEAIALMKNAYECLMVAIDMVKPGVLYRKLGEAIEAKAAEGGFSVTRSYCGHGVNELFHPAPNIPHYAGNKAVGVMKPGHFFTIEPMINQGTWKDDLWPDDWTAVTTDGKLSAQFEHTMMVTEDGVDVLTARTENSVPFPWES